MTAIRENGTTLLASFEYDQLGRRDRLILGNGAVTDYQYDSASRLSKLIHDPAGSGHDSRRVTQRNASSAVRCWKR